MIRVLCISAVLIMNPLISYSDPKEDALDVLNKWTRAFAEADVDGIVHLYSNDALFLGTGSKLVVTQTEEIRGYFETALLNDRPRTATINNYSAIELSEAVVVFSGLDTITGVRNGNQTISNGRVTIVVAMRNGEWKIVQFHRSQLPE